jgi:hypothetical protein
LGCWAGEEIRAKDAKDAKDAKVKGKKAKRHEDDEIAGVVEEWVFGLDKDLDDQGTGQ